MAVNCLASNVARIEFGDIAALGVGLNTITVSITINPSSIANGNRICGQWGSAPNAFLMQAIGTTDMGFVIGIPSSFHGVQTTGAPLATGNIYRIVGRWNSNGGAGPTTHEIWINGVNQTVSGWIVSADGTMQDGSANVAVGYESGSSTAGVDGDFSEFAIHTSYMPDDYCIAYGNGYSPAFYRSNGVIYAPLINAGQLQDRWGGATGTNTGATSAPHHRIIMPTRAGKLPWIPAETVSI